MHTRRHFRASFFAILCSFACACGSKEAGSLAGSELGLVFGHVRTEDGSELQKVTVRAGDRSVETDRRGNFQIKVEPGEERRVAVDSREFAGGQALLKLDKGSKASVELAVMKVRSFKVMDAEKGGRFEDDEGFAIELPKEALRLADDGVAKGEAEIRYATVRDPTLMRVPPELKDERDVQLSSKGLLEVRFYQGSDPLAFKGEAKIEVPLPPESGLSGGERIRLYHYDEQSRRFKQEGEAAISEDQKWVATVDKFSWWTAAEPIENAGCVSAELRAGGEAAAGVLVTATGRGELWSASALTDADGHVCVHGPASSELSLAAFFADGDAESRWSHDAVVPDAAGMCGGDACADLGAQPLDGTERDASVAPDDAGVSPADGGAGSDGEMFFYVVSATPNGFSGFITTLRVASDGTLSTVGQRTMGVGRPLSMTGSPDGRFLYVPSTRGPILTFAVDAATGALSQLGEGVEAGAATQEVEVDATGRFLYATNYTSQSVSIFSIAADGLLVSEGSVPTGGGTPIGLAIDPELRFVFVANRDTRGPSSFSVDQSSGQLAPLEPSIPATAARPNALVATRDGRFLFAQMLGDATIVAYEIGSSGTLTAIDPPTAVPGVAQLAIHPTLNVLYATRNGAEAGVSAFSIADDGALSALGSVLPIGDGAGSILIDPTGRFAFALNTLSNDISTYTIESSGELSAGPLYEAASLSNPQGGVFVPVGP